MKMTLNEFVHVRRYKNLKGRNFYHIINERTGEILQITQAAKVLEAIKKMIK